MERRLTALETNRKVESNAVEMPSVSLPSGGGAIRGIDEKFTVNPANGTVSLSIPVPSASSRGFAPVLSLDYDSGSGNGVFGQGWTLSLPVISRKTDIGIPEYDDDKDSDVFVLSGAEDLVPVIEPGPEKNFEGCRPVETVKEYDGAGCRVRLYRPRTEGLFLRIERFSGEDGTIFWKVTDRSGVVTVYGSTPESRLSSPDGARTFRWYPEYSYDIYGNLICYRYSHESSDDLDLSKASNRNRTKDGKINFSGIYVSDVLYGNRTPFRPGASIPGEDGFRFLTRFSYSTLREDAFSSYRSGFEVRTSRLCTSITNVNRFLELPYGEAVVSSIDLEYDSSGTPALLHSVRKTGYIRHPDGHYTRKSFPASIFSYSGGLWNPEIHFLDDVIGINEKFTDLYGDGLPGLLSELDGNWYYRENLGDGTFSGPTVIANVPSFAGRGLEFADLDADGSRQLVNLSFEPRGFFEMGDGTDGSMSPEPMERFSSNPLSALGSKDYRMIDLTGDGKPDILVAENEVFTWYRSEGRKGYSEAGKVYNPIANEAGACISFCDSEQTVFLADMSGDGLPDIVRVRNSEVCYWPNLGYGRFGHKITMDHSPVFDDVGAFNPSLIRFADIDGSGAADIVYYTGGRLECWLNIAGSHFRKEPYVVDSVPKGALRPCPDLIDLFGSGTSCMVWVSADGHTKTGYANLMSGHKPYIMTAYVTGGGCSMNFGWTSSVKYHVCDKLDGHPWPEKLPFPVMCLSRVEKRDLVTGRVFVSEYSYHDGHYDHSEREFRGFGTVVRTDTEQYEKWRAGSGTTALREDLFQKPVVTKTRFHTGSVESPVEISVLPGLDHSLADGLDARSWKNAHRAAKGMEIEITVTDSEGKLYSEEKTGLSVLLVQPGHGTSPAVFMPVASGTLAYSYEGGDLDDPRVSQSIILSRDDIGNVRESVSIIYPRRKTDTALPENVSAMQSQCRISFSRTEYTNDLTDDSRYFLRIPYLSETFVLEDVPCPAGQYRASDFASAEDYGSLSSRSLTLFCSEGFEKPVPEGCLECMPMVWCNYVQAFTDEMLADTYGGKVSDDEMLKAGYCRVKGREGWWMPSGRTIFLSDGEYLEDLKARFYTPLVYESVLGARTLVRYHDSECLMMESVEDAFGNVTRVLGFDWRNLSPVRIEDANGNVSASVTDELGMLAAYADCGKDGGVDSLEGFSPEDMEGEDAMVRSFFEAKDYPEIEKIARQLLRSASVRYVYLIDRVSEGKPLSGAVIRRERHSSCDSMSPLQISFEYTGGLGEVILAKVQAEAGDGSDAVRWLGNGRTVYNNKGNPVMQYEPYFSDSPGYEDASRIVCHGVTPLMFYDPLGRLVKTEFPDGTYSVTEFDEWKTVESDPVDNVMDSGWLACRDTLPADNPEKDAAEKSKALAHTPLTSYLDSSGRQVYAVASDGTHKTTIFDKFGNLAEVLDSRSVSMMKARYDLLGNLAVTTGADDGMRMILVGVTGAPVLVWDGRGHCRENFLDIAGRPSYSVVSGGELSGNVVKRNVYAEDLIAGGFDREELKKGNHIGRLVHSYDTSGSTEVMGYDFAGRVTGTRFRLAKDWKNTVNWTTGSLETGLEKEEFISRCVYDALGRTVISVLPDGSELVAEFGRGGLLKSQSLKRKDEETGRKYIKSLAYNEKRQRLRTVYGNDVSVKCSYDPLSFRLTRMYASRKNGEVVQDLNYTYDAAGNLTRLSDKAIPVEFNGNRMITGDSDYTYDSNYRLIRATGRENNAALHNAGVPGYADGAFRSFLSSGNPIGLRSYIESYDYDAAGNILLMKHVSQGNNWTRRYDYAEDSNRLLSTRTGDSVSRYSYDSAHGFITGMPHLTRMNWNFRDELIMTSRQAAGDESAETTWYCYDGSGQRTRKLTVSGKDRSGEDVVREERIYLGAYELYRCHNGVHAGLERTTISFMDDSDRRFAIVETRNDVDDGSEKSLSRYQLDNLIGSCTVELDSESAVISYEEYHPYGSTAYQATARSVKAAAKRYRYTGMERDEETGLACHTARYYIPWLGRWTAPDPIGIDGGLNLYCYCSGNPVINSDSSGTRPFPGMGGSEMGLRFENSQQKDLFYEVDKKINQEVAKELPAMLTVGGGTISAIGWAKKAHSIYKLVKTAEKVNTSTRTFTAFQKGSAVFFAVQAYQTVDDTQQAVRQLGGNPGAASLTASVTESVCNYTTGGEVPQACAVSGVLVQTAVGLGSGAAFSKMEDAASLAKRGMELKALDNQKELASVLETNHTRLGELANKKSILLDYQVSNESLKKNKSDLIRVQSELDKAPAEIKPALLEQQEALMKENTALTERVDELKNDLGPFDSEEYLNKQIRDLEASSALVKDILSSSSARARFAEQLTEYAGSAGPGWDMLDAASTAYTKYTTAPMLTYNVYSAWNSK